MTNLFSILSSAVAEASAIRLVVHLRPANADGLVYPPTYEGGMHIFRPAWIDGVRREAVLLDSVQSQANRVETAILDSYRRNHISYPDIELNVNARTGTERYSVLELSHRVYDAALRMSTVDGVPFPQSEIGKAVYLARTERATAMYTHAPITLTLGGWDSHGGGGPLAAKLPRIMTSEIVGLDAQQVKRGAVKSDPMDIRKDAGLLYQSETPERRWEIEETRIDKKGRKPSEVGLGSVPNLSDQGAVITEAVQTSVISCSAVRRLRFEREDTSYADLRDYAGQTAVVSLGLFGLIAQMHSGYYLRSGCDLFALDEPKLEVIGRTLQDSRSHAITVIDAKEALEEALNDAQSHNLEWRKESITAQADERLVALVERSRKATNGAN
jgi:CRISPR-associated protein Csb1